jgi:hypothetical protein
MSLASLVEGEGKLFGFLGANVTLGGAKAVVDKAHTQLDHFMPILNNSLVLVQVAVGLATLVYMVLKIRKILKK